ncbi:hypothetical protein N9059_00685, partial [bacterium]|nr:hypothetical protein [bacterium]
EFASFMMLAVLFTGLGVMFFALFTRETGFRREMRAAFQRRLKLMKKSKALMYILPVWIFLLVFNFNRTVGDRFIGVRQEVDGLRTTWVFVYSHPARERRVMWANGVGTMAGHGAWSGLPWKFNWQTVGS